MQEVFEEMGTEEKILAAGVGLKVPQRLETDHPAVTLPLTHISPGVHMEAKGRRK